MKAAKTDIDIDVSDRSEILKLVKHIPASLINQGEYRIHPNGVYFHDVPVDPVSGNCSILHKEAEERGFFKIDFLNVSVYKGVRNEQHQIELMNKEPIWELLQDEDFVTGNNIWQIHEHSKVLQQMKPSNIHELAMTVAIIRPPKMHLIGKSWDEVAKEIWILPPDPKKSKQCFKKSHSYSYALAIVVQMNSIVEQLFVTQNV